MEKETLNNINGSGLRNNLTIANSIKNLVNVMGKYRHYDHDVDHVYSICKQLEGYGRDWYEAYSELVNENVEEVNEMPALQYFLNRQNQIERSAKIDNAEGYINKLLQDEDFIRFMGMAKSLSSTLYEKSHNLDREYNACLEQSNNLTWNCQDIENSYLNAGVSKDVLTDFVLFQNKDYKDKHERISELNTKMDRLTKISEKYYLDSKDIDSLVKTIEYTTFITYKEPDEQKTYTQEMYQRNIDNFLGANKYQAVENTRKIG